jgi:hypothetical protein
MDAVAGGSAMILFNDHETHEAHEMEPRKDDSKPHGIHEKKMAFFKSGCV